MKETQNINSYINKHITDFRRLGTFQKVATIAIMISLFFLGVYSSQLVFPVSKPSRTETVSSPTPTIIPIPATLTLISDKKEALIGATFSATISIDSPNQQVEASEIYVIFDPDYLDIATVSAGSYYSLYPVLKKVGADSAKIFGMANLVNNKFLIPVGRGILAQIIFETIAATESTKIFIDPVKTIAASNGKNILGEINDLIIGIK